MPGEGSTQRDNRQTTDNYDNDNSRVAEFLVRHGSWTSERHESEDEQLQKRGNGLCVDWRTQCRPGGAEEDERNIAVGEKRRQKNAKAKNKKRKQ